MQNSDKPIKSIIRVVNTVLYVDEIAHEAMVNLRKQQVDERIVYFYVLDRERRLVGVVSTRALLLAAPHKKVSEIMEDKVIYLHEDQTIKESMAIFAKHALLSLPVVDKEKKFIGAVDVDIYVEKSYDLLNAEHRKDVFQFIGLTLEEQRHSIWRGYKNRIPWLLCNLFGGIGCAVIVHLSKAVLSQCLFLVLFIPLMLSLSEAVSMQSMTQSLYFFKGSIVSWRHFFMKSIKELKIVFLLAFSIAILVSSVALFFARLMSVAFIIGATIATTVIISSCFGIFIPFILHKAELDPKVSSGPVVLMISDVMTTAVYLLIATLLLI
jgi:magnesium transporter